MADIFLASLGFFKLMLCNTGLSSKAGGATAVFFFDLVGLIIGNPPMLCLTEFSSREEETGR
eukprot:800185-Prorocentrum_minimum.AAC.1